MHLLHLDPKSVLLLQVVVVVGVPLILWRPLRLGRFFPLPVIQIFAGIALGPTIFGQLAPGGYQFLFHQNVLAGVETLANVAVVLFVFLAGCEADKQILRNAAGTVVRIQLCGIVLSWGLGALAAWSLIGLPGALGMRQDPGLFAIAFGLCMAVTALPVLAVVLRELGFNQRPIGTIALAIGGLDDGLLWLSLAVLLPFAAGASSFAASFATAIIGGAITILVMAYVVSPFLARLIRQDAPERLLMSAAILVLFAAAAVTEITGLHAVLGAFITGLLLPEKLRHMAYDRLDVPVNLLLLPFLFLATGLKTDFQLTDPTVWQIVAVALIVCVGGKFIGIGIPAYLSRLGLPFSLTLASLLQCKGLMEIVIVTVLYQRGIFGSSAFAALVITALISTALTVPMARLMQRIFGADAATEPAAPEQTAVMAPEPTVVAAPAATPAAAAVAARGPVLVFDHAIGEVPLTKNEMVIGRHSQDDIRVNDVRISRHHALLKALEDGRYEIHNQTAVRSEPNPIKINGEEKEHAVLADGDVVSIGGVTFTFRKGEQRLAA